MNINKANKKIYFKLEGKKNIKIGKVSK